MKTTLSKLFFVIILLIGVIFFFEENTPTESAFAATDIKESILLKENGLQTLIQTTRAETVEQFLTELNLPSITPDDALWPSKETHLHSDMTIILDRAKTISIHTKDSSQTVTTTLTTIQDVLNEQHITLNEDDFTLPTADTPLTDKLSVNIIRVVIEEKAIDSPIAFEKQVKENSELSWRKTLVEQKGVPGIRTKTYKIVSHNGKEISRKLLKTEVTRDPVMEIITQGTFVQVGKAHAGFGSWYAFTGTLSAANPWLPIGSYVRVTNKANSKSVIVRINDRGPFGPNRIIDLDKVAFEKIASLGAGIIDVKMEEITN